MEAVRQFIKEAVWHFKGWANRAKTPVRSIVPSPSGGGSPGFPMRLEEIPGEGLGMTLSASFLLEV
jgi:hypothetical protein